MSTHRLVVSTALAALLFTATAAQAQNIRANLTEEEARRPAEQWTLEQAAAKGWKPYGCCQDAKHNHALPHAPEPAMRRWPRNDPGPARAGSCISYSFMPLGAPLEPGEGSNTFPVSMPPGSAAAFTAATTTWAAAADLHFTMVADGGGPWNAAGPAGLNGNIRVAAGPIPTPGVLAHAYYPPPNFVSAAGDVHFNDGFAWTTTAPAPGPPFDVETVALHELGHSLGLDHVGTVPGDIMFPFYGGLQRTLSPGDIAFITSIYGASGHAAECSGACCFGPRFCADLSSTACSAQMGQFRGIGSRCPTQGVIASPHIAPGAVHITNPAINCLNITPSTSIAGDISTDNLTINNVLVVDSELNQEEELTVNGDIGTGGDCCTPHPSPGCDDLVCQQAVCELDPVCCSDSWDFVCADLASDVCDSCGPPVTSGCVPGLLIDPWVTLDDELTCHGFGTVPKSPPIPPGFFGPGSEPFFGDVCFIGEPLGPTPFGEYGLADTLVLRSNDPFDRCDLPSPDQRTVDIEIVALSLRSIQPIQVQVQNQPTLWDVQVDLSDIPSPPGQIHAVKTHCNGGTYSSILPVRPRFTFIKVGGAPFPPNGSTQVLDTGLEGIPEVIFFQDANTPWVNDLDPYLSLENIGPNCTRWYPAVNDPVQSLGCDCNNTGTRDDCDIESGLSNDCNSNGIPDECEPDLDGDGIPDDCDNCPDVNNPNQAPLCLPPVVASCSTDCDCILNALSNGDPINSCDYNYCDNGSCATCERTFGNTCAPFGGVVQTNDILCAVAGFGNYCSCPNADLVAPGGTQGPNGSPIGTNDILAVVGAFGGANPFGCAAPAANACDSNPPPAPGGCSSPATVIDPQETVHDSLTTADMVQESATAGFRIVPRKRAVRAGSVVEVDIYVSGVEGLIGYEFGLAAAGGKQGNLSLVGVDVNTDRADYVFNGLQNFPATDEELGRIGGIAIDAGVFVSEEKQAYLGTFTFDVRKNARGAFNLEAMTEFVALYTNDGQQLVNPTKDAVVLITGATSGR